MPFRSRRNLLPLLALGLLGWTGCEGRVPTQTAGLPSLSLPQVEEASPATAGSPSPSATPTPSPTAVPSATASPSPTPAGPTPTAQPTKAPMASKPLTQLGRGMNLGNALEAPKEGDWGIVLQPSDFEAIQAAGFTTVRVPVRWSAHAASKSPYGIDPAFLTRVDKVVAMAKAYELTVVLDMHSYDELYANPSAEEPKYLWLWKQIAWHYSNEPETLAFELLNEPHGALDARKWNALLGKAIAAVRSLDPTRTLIIDGPNNSAASELAKLTLPAKDEHVVGTFHLYTPMLFTHQGASFAGPEYSTTGVQWPGPPSAPMAPAGTAGLVGWVQNWFSDYSTLPAETNPAGPEAIRKDFDQATAWAELTGHPVWLGEFGVYEQADMASRAAWTRFVREEAEQRGMPWAYWEFGAGFGAYDRTAGAWKEPLKAALLD